LILAGSGRWHYVTPAIGDLARASPRGRAFGEKRVALRRKFGDTRGMAYRMSTRRRLAIASWGDPHEGNIYGKLTIDATAALAYIDALRKASGEKVTIGHLVAKAVGAALASAPTLNGRILWGRYIPHKTVDLSFLVAMEGADGADLAMTKIENVDKLSVVDIARMLGEGAQRLRTGKDVDFNKTKGLIRIMPTFILRRLLWFTGWLSGALGITIRALGVKAFPFGAAIITNVGPFGLDEVFAPPTPFARVPVYVLLGTVREQPVVMDGAIVARPLITICATIDHRFMDGAQGAVLAKVMRKFLEDPVASLGAPTKSDSADPS